MFCIEVQPYKGSRWVQRGMYYKTKELAEKDVPHFVDGSDTGPWAGARSRHLKSYELKLWEKIKDKTCGECKNFNRAYGWELCNLHDTECSKDNNVCNDFKEKK